MSKRARDRKREERLFLRQLRDGTFPIFTTSTKPYIPPTVDEIKAAIDRLPVFPDYMFAPSFRDYVFAPIPVRPIVSVDAIKIGDLKDVTVSARDIKVSFGSGALYMFPKLGTEGA